MDHLTHGELDPNCEQCRLSFRAMLAIIMLEDRGLIYDSANGETVDSGSRPG